MKRRSFLRTSAGMLAYMSLPGCFSIQNKKSKAVPCPFRDYQPGNTYGKVRMVTPPDGFYIHTFYDICPFSPSQRYLAVSKLPYQDREATYGDMVDVCVIDLHNETIETVYSTKGWGFQLGANLNWGKTDRFLYTNDIIGNEAVCVRIDLETGETKAYSGPMYHISPDESAVAGFPLDLINITQMGYGVPKFRDVEEIQGAPADQGLWHTNLVSGETRLLVSLKDTFDKADDPEFLQGGDCYFFHTKYNRQGTRMLQVMRCMFFDNPEKKGWNPMLFTFNPDGTDIRQAVTRLQWSLRGNHPNWHPDGEHIIMNLTPFWLGEQNMRFCMFDHTGGNFRMLSEKHLGSGHPSVDPSTQWLISDYYVGEYKKLNLPDNPVRLIHLPTMEEFAICTVFTNLDIEVSTFRVDPHPAWSRDYKKVCINAAPEGSRQVLVADLEGYI